MHQVLKWKTGRINQMSDYCPLKLYSGLESVLMEAVEEMFKNPQSNLKIYYGHESLIGPVGILIIWISSRFAILRPLPFATHSRISAT